MCARCFHFYVLLLLYTRYKGRCSGLTVSREGPVTGGSALHDGKTRHTRKPKGPFDFVGEGVGGGGRSRFLTQSKIISVRQKQLAVSVVTRRLKPYNSV